MNSQCSGPYLLPNACYRRGTCYWPYHLSHHYHNERLSGKPAPLCVSPLWPHSSSMLCLLNEMSLLVIHFLSSYSFVHGFFGLFPLDTPPIEPSVVETTVVIETHLLGKGHS